MSFKISAFGARRGWQNVLMVSKMTRFLCWLKWSRTVVPCLAAVAPGCHWRPFQLPIRKSAYIHVIWASTAKRTVPTFYSGTQKAGRMKLLLSSFVMSHIWLLLSVRSNFTESSRRLPPWCEVKSGSEPIFSQLCEVSGAAWHACAPLCDTATTQKYTPVSLGSTFSTVKDPLKASVLLAEHMSWLKFPGQAGEKAQCRRSASCSPLAAETSTFDRNCHAGCDCSSSELSDPSPPLSLGSGGPH